MFTIQQSRWDKLLRRVSGSIGPGSRVGTSISDLFPVLDVESVPSELLALAGTRLCWGRVNAPVPSAGQFARCQLFNPADSGLLVTVDALWISPENFRRVEFGMLQVALSAQNAVPAFRDTRWGIAERPTAELRTEEAASSTPDTFSVVVTTGLSYPLTAPNDICVLQPGTGIVTSLNTADEAFTTSYFWRERAAEASELNF